MKHFIRILSILMLALNTHAQTRDTTKHFDDFTTTPLDYLKKDTTIYNRVAFTYNILSWARGEVPISVERTLSNLFSIQGALGISITDYYSNLIYGEASTGLNDATITTRPIYVTDANVKIGPLVQFGMRMYPNKHPMSGIFIQGGFLYRYNTVDYPTYANNVVTRNQYRGDISSGEAQLIIGYATDYGFNTDNCDEEYYVGIGMKSISSSYELYGFDDNGNIIQTPSKLNKIAPSIYAGVKFGFIIDLEKNPLSKRIHKY